MADWAELPNDLIAEIANRVKVNKDFNAFGAVCTSWRIVATKHNFDVLPETLLQLLNDYSVFKDKGSSIFLPEAREQECIDPSEGWVCTVSNTGEMNLLHPHFSPTQVESEIWSSKSQNYVLVVSYDADANILALWRPGDLSWTSYIYDIKKYGVIAGLNYYDGKLFGFTFGGQVLDLNVTGPTDLQPNYNEPHLRFRAYGSLV